MEDSFNLQRFIDAQTYDYERALQEIKNGRKQSHWVWYIFPQLKGFGHSYNSEYYGISGLDEAQVYYNHPVLGSRLIEITKALLEHRGKSVQDILSPIDARKVKSCMTLFWVASGNALFKTVLDVFYEGRMDKRTMEKCGMTTKASTNMNKENTQTIEINTEIMVEINNLCHFNEPWKVANLLKYMIPDWFKDGSEGNCIYLRHIYLRHSPDPYSSVVYEGLPSHLLLFCWKEKGILHSNCYVSVAENPEFRKAFHLDFSGMDDQDCDPDELGWYYFMGKTNNLESIVNYSGTEYTPVFKMEGDNIKCFRPPLIRHHYRLPDFKDLEINTGYDALRLLLESKGSIKKAKSTIEYEKYMDLYHSGNWNAKHAIERGGFNLNG